jgi:Effector Associated Constant Component 1
LAKYLEVELTPGTTRFDLADERWLGQVRDLQQGFQQAGVLVQRSLPEAGSKGAIDQLIISLGSAGAFTASIEIVKAWLGRAHDRRLSVKFFENGRPQEIELRGSAADEAAFERIHKYITG